MKHYLTHEVYEAILQSAKDFSDMPLPIWHLGITGKCLYELSNFDLIRCIRQDIFTDLVTFEIIERIDKYGSPFYADIDSIELMEKLSSVGLDILSIYREKLNRIIKTIEQNRLIDLADIWLVDEQKEVYQDYVNRLKNKICYT